MTNILKYVGMDVHQAITVIVLLNAAGQIESRTQVKTTADNLRSFFRGLSGLVQVAFEEGTQSAWLYDLLKPLVATVTVCDARALERPHGHKSDDADALWLARKLRAGELRAVYKGDAAQQQLKALCRTYTQLVTDTTRVKNRLKALYRARGLACPGQEIYRADKRAEYLAQLPEETVRWQAESLLDQLAALRPLRKQAKQRMQQRARAHPDFARLAALPGFGAVHVSLLLAIVGTPQRFRTKRQFWPYCGLAVVTQSTADYQAVGDKIVRAQQRPATRGLNRNHQPQLKQVFKSAALTALRYPEWRAYYDQLVKQGTRPELARVTLARKLAAVTLTIWQQHTEYDATQITVPA